MSRILTALAISSGLSIGAAQAEAPSVAVDIMPLHSLVARVMDGVGTPDLIVSQGASPHGYSLRPSQAQALQDAQVLFWIGEGLTPWLEGAVETVARSAKSVELLEHPATEKLEFREGALFEHDDHEEHDEHEEGHDDHAENDEHEEHAEHAEDKHADHEEHAEHEGEDHAEHDKHGDGHDPHAWLSLANATAWLDIIAQELSEIDPGHAEIYRANAAAARGEMELLTSEVDAILQPVRGNTFVVFHDAYQYFENSFGVFASGAIAIGDASEPSPARIAEIQDRVADQGVSCVLSEPQFNPSLVATVLDGTEAKTAVLDPLGSDLKPGADLYPQLIRNLATSLAECF